MDKGGVIVTKSKDEGIGCIVICTMLLIFIFGGGLLHLHHQSSKPVPLPIAVTELMAGLEKPAILTEEREKLFFYKDETILRLTNASPLDKSAVRCRIEVLTMVSDRKEYFFKPILRIEVEATIDEAGKMIPKSIALVPCAGDPHERVEGTIVALPDENGVLCTLETPWMGGGHYTELRLQLKMTAYDERLSAIAISINELP